jgi:MGT family glycosyltransferase
LYRTLYLAHAPPSFASAEVESGTKSALAATTRFIRPQFYDDAGEPELPAWVTQLPRQPTVYVTLGTEVNSEPELYPSVMQTLIEGLRQAPLNLIVTLGRDKDPAEFGAQPGNVHIERYIPQSRLLPYCDLMVMHGGSNTLLAAFDLGMPLVIVPLIADQYFNAHITASIGAGRVVQRHELTPRAIREAVEDALVNPSYRHNAQELQAELHALPDQRHAVELLEHAAAGQEL